MTPAEAGPPCLVATCGWDGSAPHVVSGRVFASCAEAWAAIVALDPLAGKLYDTQFKRQGGLSVPWVAPWTDAPQPGSVHRWVLVPVESQPQVAGPLASGGAGK